jgi:hypothetical protein
MYKEIEVAAYVKAMSQEFPGEIRKFVKSSEIVGLSVHIRARDLPNRSVKTFGRDFR